MKRRQFLTAAAATGVVAASSFPSPAISQNRIQWRMALTWPKNAPLLSTGYQLLAEFLNKATQGRFTIEVFGAGELVPPFQVLEAVAAGTVESGQGFPTFWAGKDPTFNMVVPLPFSVNPQEYYAWLTHGGGMELCEKVYDRQGVKFFVLGRTSFQTFGWYTKEINSLADLKGLKVRMGGLGGEVLRRVGVTVTLVPLGEVLQALQSGALDGAEFVGPFSDMSFGLYRSAKYYYWPGVLEASGILDLMINKQAWSALTPDLQELVRVGVRYADAIVHNEYLEKDAQALATLKEKHQVQVRRLNDDIIKELGRVSGEVISEVAAKDALAKELTVSQLKYRGTMIPYTELSQGSYNHARGLDFPFVKL